MKLDLEAETAILRKKNRFGSRSIFLTLFVGFAFAIVSVGIGVGEKPPNSPLPPWVPFAIAGGIVLLGGFAVLLLSIKRNALIERGVIINAVPGRAMRIYRSIYRVTAKYDVEGIIYSRPVYVDSATCAAIECTGCIMVVVLAHSPETMSPLHTFANWKDSPAVASGTKGL